MEADAPERGEHACARAAVRAAVAAARAAAAVAARAAATLSSLAQARVCNPREGTSSGRHAQTYDTRVQPKGVLHTDNSF